MGSRWGIRILMVAFGLFVGAMILIGALSSVSALGTTVDEDLHRTLLLTVVGKSLEAAGIVGLYVSLALGFPDWESWLRHSGPRTEVPGGRRGLRRAGRQIDGKEPYRVDEIPHLRALAARRMTARRSRGAERLQVISLILFCTGFLVGPPEFHVAAINLVYTVLAVVMVLFFVVWFVASFRTQSTAKTEAFLLRTQSEAGSC